jgi:NTE family protein
MKWMNQRIGLALGGGGARGLAHIGVLRVFEEETIPVDILVGTSAGALVGGAYAGGTSLDELVHKVNHYLQSPEFQSSAIKALEDTNSGEELGLAQKIQAFVKNRFYLAQAMFRPGILSREDFQSMIDYFIPDILIEDTWIPFRAVATDLVSGKQVTFSSGSLRHAVMASCAVPGAIEPLKEGDMWLSDGGIICLVPSTVARKEGSDIVIAVAVDPDICTAEEFHTCREVLDRATEIMAHQLENYELGDADIVIRPLVGDLHWSDFSHAGDLIAEGEKAAREKLEDIRKAIPVFKKWFTLKQLLEPQRKEH